MARTGLVEFAAVHFSDFVIANEYLLNFVFIPDVAGELTTDYTDANGKIYLPAGAKILLQFVIENNYEVDSITALDGTTYAVGSEFTMPAAAETLTVRVRARLYSVNYYYYDYASGTLKQAAMPYQYYTGTFDRAIALAPVVSDEARNSAPAGYGRDFTWSDLDMNQVGVTDISLFMIHTPISYTVNFVNAKDGSIISSINGLTVENYETLYKLPQAPGGLVSNWTVAWIEKPTDLNDPAQNTITVVLNGQFETVKFAIVHGAYVTDETPFEAQQGESVKVVVEDRFGYTAQIVVKNAAGELIEVTNGSFTMPAASVAISVVYTPATFSYQINKVPGVGTYLDTIPVEITLKKGEVLTSISADCTLVSTVKNGDETVLTYSFVLDGDKTITYVVEKSKPVIYRIFNGALFNDGFMPTMDGTVNFERWSNPLFDALSFAVFSAVETECSLVWLWILIAVLALFLLIVILYVLSLKGKTVKFLTRAAVAVVGAFFALCILMAKLALKVASLFGKDDAPEDYGFTEESDKQDQ